MTDDRTQSRAEHPLPEEQAVGSDDFQEQAEAILRESDIREEEPEARREEVLEHRTSDEATD
jgi:hypothetical protein